MGGVAVGLSVIAAFATLRTLGWGFRDGQPAGCWNPNGMGSAVSWHPTGWQRQLPRVKRVASWQTLCELAVFSPMTDPARASASTDSSTTIRRDRALHLGARIRRARRDLGLSQTQIGREVGVDGSLISRWETGTRSPELWHIVDLAGSLDVPVGWLVLGQRGLPGGSATVSAELQGRGLPLGGGTQGTLWALRPIEETIADSLRTPEPRIIDRLPGVLLREPFRPHTLWGLCRDAGPRSAPRRVEYRLGWALDLARLLANRGLAPLPDGVESALALVCRPEPDSPFDSLGAGAKDPGALPPIWRRWRVSYDQDLSIFESHVAELLRNRAERR